MDYKRNVISFNHMKYSLPLFFLTFLLLTIGSCENRSRERARNSSERNEISQESETRDGFFLVKKVVDGDTFYVDDGSKKGLKVRLIGVDTPETRRTGRKEIGYFGKEAKEYMISLIANKKVRLELDVKQFDRYQRTLAYVYLEDGTFVNAELIKNGFAMVMTIPPNVKFADEFVRLQQEARANNRGLWKSQNGINE